MGPNPDRILRERTVTCMAAPDTIAAITLRVRNLLAADRRITVADRYTHTDGTPDVYAGLTVEEIRTGREGGIGVHLKPGRVGFGVHSLIAETEAQAWDLYHREQREHLTRVEIRGGLPNSGPAGDDRLVIRHWISDRVCREWVIVFDDAPDIRMEVENLAFALGEVREFVGRYPTLTPELRAKLDTGPPEEHDPEMAVVERIRDILRRHDAAVRRG